MKPLYDKICEYVAKNPARFHMPAHFGTGDNPLFSSAKYDVTELDFSDNLQNPTKCKNRQIKKGIRLFICCKGYIGCKILPDFVTLHALSETHVRILHKVFGNFPYPYYRQ